MPGNGQITTRFGRQPICDVLHDHRWTTTRFAAHHGLNRNHLYNASTGRVAVSRELQHVLPDLLGIPLDELFTSDSIISGNHSKVALAVQS